MNIILQGLHQSASDCMYPKERHEVLDITNEYLYIFSLGVWIFIIFIYLFFFEQRFIIFIEVCQVQIFDHTLAMYDVSLTKKKSHFVQVIFLKYSYKYICMILLDVYVKKFCHVQFFCQVTQLIGEYMICSRFEYQLS